MHLSSVNLPILWQIALAVFLLFPVFMIMRMPACLQSLMVGEYSILGGSSLPKTPAKLRLTLYWANLTVLLKVLVLGVGG